MDIKKYIYTLYKDSAVCRKVFLEIVSKKHNIAEEEIINIYNDIVNYQIKKYGTQLYGKMYEDVEKKKKRNEARAKRKKVIKNV